MNRRTDRPAVLRDSWRPDEAADPRKSRAWKIARLLALFLVLAAGLAAFFYLLAEPILHPNTYLVLASGDSTEPGELPPVHFSQPNLLAFEDLSPMVAQDARQMLGDPLQLVPNQELNLLQERIRSFQTADRDVLLVYIAAHGLVVNGKPCLVCDGFDPASPGVGSVTIRSLLDLIRQSEAQTKLVLLDSGQLPFDARLGVIGNQFVSRLREEVRELNAENLWVLASNDLNQNSSVIEGAATSVFAYYVRMGLQGHADLDGDGFLHLREFFVYVRDRVGHYTGQQRHTPVQTPVLISSTEISGDPVLMSVQVGWPTTESDEGAGDAKTAQTTSEARDANSDGGVSPEADAPSASAAASNPAGRAADTSNGSAGDQQAGDPEADEPAASNLAEVTGAERSEPGANRPAESLRLSLDWHPEISTEQEKRLESVWSGVYGSHADLVGQVWELYFEVNESLSYPRRPFDVAPVEWRKIGEQIAHHDYAIRQNQEPAQAADRLRELQAALSALRDGQPLPATGKLELAQKIIDRLPRPVIEPDSVVSLSQLRELTRQGFCRIPESLRQSLLKFDAATTAPTAQPLTELLTTETRLQQWHEPWLAQRLLETEGLSWEQQQQALRAISFNGKSCHPLAGAFRDLARKFELADRSRRLGVQLLLEQTVPDWRQRSEAVLAEAVRRYESASRELQLLEAGFALRNDLLFRLPYYLRFPYPDSRIYVGEVYHRLDRLMNSAARLCDLLANREQVEVAAGIAMASAEVVERHREFLESIVQRESGGDANADAGKESLVNLQAALLTPAGGRRMRSAWLADLLENRPPEAAAPEALQVDRSAKLVSADAAPNELMAYQRQTELVLKLARLAGIPGVDEPRMNSLEQRIRNCFDTDLRSSPDFRERESIDRINDEMGQFLRGLPLRLEQALAEQPPLSDLESHSQSLDRLEELLTSRLMIDARDSRLADLIAVSEQRAQAARCFAMLRQQRQQVLAELELQTKEPDVPILKKLERLRMAANELPDQPALAREPPAKLQLQASSPVRLAAEDTREIQVEIRFRGESPEPLWLVAEYDTTKLEIIGDPQRPLVDRNAYLDQVPAMLDPGKLRTSIQQLESTDAGPIPPTVVLQPGQNRSIRIQLSLTGDVPAAHLVLTAVTPTLMVRRQVDVVSPQRSNWDLFLESPDSLTTTRGSELIVSPLPNRNLEFELGLRNRSGVPKKIDLQLIAPRTDVKDLPPLDELDPRQLLEYLEQIGPTLSLHSVGGIELDASNQVQPIVLQTSEEEAAGESETAAEADKTEPADRQLIRHGLLVIISDSSTLQSTVRLVRFRPQMPRKFVAVDARYDALEERIIIDVRKKDFHRVPPDGHQIRAEFADPLVRGTEAFLEGQLTRDNDQLRLFARVPGAVGRVEKVYLHVDDYPRAFVLNVPCGKVSEVAAESLDEMRIQITSPTPDSGFKAPIDYIPVEFQVDAPVGAFSDPRDRIQLGLDADRDRELAQESFLEWTADRQTTIWTSGIGTSPKLTLENEVGDYRVRLPGASYRNLRVNLLGRLRIGQQEVWSRPREIWLDADPPEIVSIKRMSTGWLTPEDKLVLRIVADDRQMSGVASVKVGFPNAERTRFSDERPTVDATRQEDNTWLAELPLADVPLGFQTVAVSATDVVENESELKTLGIKVVTQEEKAAEPRTFVVTGSVRYYKMMQADVRVQLTADSGQTLETTTAEDGSFRIAEVPAGKYQLKAKSVIRNKPRIATIELDLQDGEPVRSLDVELQ